MNPRSCQEMKKLVLLLVCAFTTLGTIEPIFAKPDTDDFIQGQASVKTGNFRQALTLFDDAIDKDPDYARAYLARATTEIRLKKFDRALADTDKAHKLGLGSAELYATKAEALLNLHRFEDSLASVNDALTLEGKSPKATTLVIRAQAFGKSGQYEKAFIDYQLALKLEPGSSETLSKRASLCLELEQYQRAVDDSTKAISFDRSCALAYWVRSKAQFALGKKSEATSDKEMAKRLGFKDS